MIGALALIFSWIKVVSYLRALSGFAFIMLMLISVFNDMKYFLFMLLWILLGFSFSCKQFFNKIIESWDALKTQFRTELKHF